MPAAAQLFAWLFVILILLVGLFAAVSVARRYLKDSDDTPSEIFSLSDLRELLKQGKITQAEFDQLKQHIIAMTQAEAQPKPEDKGNPIPPAV